MLEVTVESRCTTSPFLGQLATALALAQGQMRGAIRDSENPHLRSKYADLASVWDACRTALSANGLSVVQCPDSEGPKVTMTTFLLHNSGEFIKSVLSLSSMKEKLDSPQVAGSTITYARRYALSAMVGISPADDDDAEAAMVRPVQRASPRQALPAEKPKPAAPPVNAGELAQIAPAWMATRDRGAMRKAFAVLKDLVGDQHYFYILSHHDITINEDGELQGKVGKLLEAYNILQVRATELAQQGAPV